MPDEGAKAAAETAALFAVASAAATTGEQFRHDQQSHRGDEHPGGADRVLRRPLREQREAVREIFRAARTAPATKSGCRRRRNSQPQRRGDVGADAGQEMQPRHPVQAARRQHLGSAADCPGTSAGRARRSRSSTAALPRSCRAASAPCGCAQPARRISAASTKSWLRMWPPNGLRPGSIGRPALAAKARDADDRVVAPVVAFRAVPPGDAVRRSSGRRGARRTAAAARTACAH